MPTTLRKPFQARPAHATTLAVLAGLLAVLIVVVGASAQRDAAAVAAQPSDDVIVPILYVASDRVDLVERLDVVDRFQDQLDEFSEFFTWSTGGLELKLTDPEVVYSDSTTAQLWCGDRRPLLVNCREFFESARAEIAAKTDIRDGAVQWVFAWGGSGYAAGPEKFAMTGEAASVAFYDGGSADCGGNRPPAFAHDDAPVFFCLNVGRAGRIGNGGANLHELGHAAWLLGHSGELSGVSRELADTSIMQNHARYPAGGWLDPEIAQIEAEGYTTGRAKPRPATPTVNATRIGNTTRVRVTVTGSIETPSTRLRIYDHSHLAEVRLLGEFSGQTGVVEVPVATCLWVSIWDSDHRPAQSITTGTGAECVGPTSAGGCLHHAPTISFLSASGPSTIHGTPGDDVILGSRFDDVILAGDGDDLICGLDGNDSIWGQDGDDKLLGGAGDDRMRGGRGNDALIGSGGSDDLNGGAGNDLVLAETGDDPIVRGGTGDDLVSGGAGNDGIVNGNGGYDIVLGHNGNDALVAGGPRPDYLVGGDGNDRVKGHGGADYLLGGAGDDSLFGGRQSDSLDGGPGSDSCNGGLEIDIVLGGCEELTLAPRSSAGDAKDADSDGPNHHHGHTHLSTQHKWDPSVGAPLHQHIHTHNG